MHTISQGFHTVCIDETCHVPETSAGLLARDEHKYESAGDRLEHNAWHKLISSSSSSSPIAAHQQASDRYSVQLEIPMISKVQAV